MAAAAKTEPVQLEVQLAERHNVDCDDTSRLLCMPTEILILVFTFTLVPQNTRRSVETAPWTASQVCRRWRDISISCPLLWVSVGLDFKSTHPYSIFRLETQLQRSGLLPLQISFLCPKPRYSLLTADSPLPMVKFRMLEILAKHSTRWETCYISCMRPLCAALDSIPNRLPLLTQLRLELYPDPRIDMQVPVVIFQFAPRLHRAFIDAVCPVLLPFQQLERYRVAKVVWLQVHLPNLRAAAAGNIVDCAIDMGEGYINTFPTKQILLFPHLLRLSISDDRFLECIAAPALQELYCKGNRAGHIGTFLQRTPTPQLRKLFVTGAKSSHRVLKAISGGAPSLTHLALELSDHWVNNVFQSLILGDTGSSDAPTHANIFPALQWIAICPTHLWPWVRVDLFLDMLESRAGTLRTATMSAMHFPEEAGERLQRLRDEGLKYTTAHHMSFMHDLIPPHLHVN